MSGGCASGISSQGDGRQLDHGKAVFCDIRSSNKVQIGRWESELSLWVGDTWSEEVVLFGSEQAGENSDGSQYFVYRLFVVFPYTIQWVILQQKLVALALGQEFQLFIKFMEVKMWNPEVDDMRLSDFYSLSSEKIKNLAANEDRIFGNEPAISEVCSKVDSRDPILSDFILFDGPDKFDGCNYFDESSATGVTGDSGRFCGWLQRARVVDGYDERFPSRDSLEMQDSVCPMSLENAFLSHRDWDDESVPSLCQNEVQNTPGSGSYVSMDEDSTKRTKEVRSILECPPKNESVDIEHRVCLATHVETLNSFTSPTTMAFNCDVCR